MRLYHIFVGLPGMNKTRQYKVVNCTLVTPRFMCGAGIPAREYGCEPHSGNGNLVQPESRVGVDVLTREAPQLPAEPQPVVDPTGALAHRAFNPSECSRRFS